MTKAETGYWRNGQRRHVGHGSGEISIRRAGDALLIFIMGLAIFRGSQIWYGYPTAQDEIVPGGTIRDSVMLYALLVLSTGYSLVFYQDFLKRIAQSNFLLIIFYIFVVLSVCFSVDKPASLISILGVLSLSLSVLIFRWRFEEAVALEIVRKLMLLLVMLNLGYCILFPRYAIMTGSLAGDWRGMFAHKNYFGHSMSFITILLMPRLDARSIRDPWTLAYAAGACLAIIFALLSHSSTAMLQIGAGMSAVIGVGIIRKSGGGLIRTLGLTALMIVLVILIFMVGSGLLAVMVKSFGKDMTFSGRSYIWAALLPHLLDYPMTGHGFGMFRDASYIHKFLASVPFQINSPHNTYIELGLSIGLPGTAAWVLFVIGRILTKILQVSPFPAARSASARNTAVLIMILIGSGTEAGQMLSTRFALVFLMLALPLDTASVRKTGKGGTLPRRSAEERPALQA